jgi:predicted dinucleotide-utilizing enzyme
MYQKGKCQVRSTKEKSAMSKQAIAIVGLGRVGSVFLEELLRQTSKGIEIVAVVEKGATIGRALAEARGIRNLSMDQLVALGSGVDILFDLTGVAAVRQELRDKMMATGNRHTIIATENIALLIWALISNGADLPNVHANTGY